MADDAISPDDIVKVTPVSSGAGIDPADIKTILPKGDLGGPNAAFRKPIPGVVSALEDYILPTVLGTAGAAGGAAIGSAIPGAGTLAGGAAGAGAGQVASDLISAGINKRFFGREPDFSARNLLPQEGINFVTGAAMQALPVGKIASAVIGATPLAAGAKQAAKEGTEALEQFGEREAPGALSAAEKASGVVSPEQGASAVTQTAAALTPEAKQQAIQGALGRTAQQGVEARAAAPEMAGGAAVPSPQVIGRQQGFYDTVFGPLRRASDELGKRYDALFAGVRQRPVEDLEGLRGALGKTQDFADQSGYTFRAPTRKVLDQAKELTGAGDPLAAYFSRDELRGMTPRQRTNLLESMGLAGRGRAAVEAARAGGGDYRVTGDVRPAQMGETPLEARGAPSGPSVDRLLTLRSEASALTRQTSLPPRDKSAAFSVIEGIDDTLESSGLVDKRQLGALNKQYRSYKSTFDQGFRHKMAAAMEPTDVAGDIFQQPQRFQQLAGAATPDELSRMRRLYGDWVTREGYKKLGDPDQAPVVRKLFAGTPLADPKNWINLDKKAANALEVMQSSPGMRLRYQHELASRLADIRHTNAQEAVNWALKRGKSLGTLGAQMAQQVKAANTPEEGAQIARDFLARAPETMPIQALKEGRTEGGSKIAQKYVGRLQWLLPLGVATALAGHPSYYSIAGIALGAPIALHEGMQRTPKYALTKPETANMFWRAISDPESYSAARTLGRLSADALMAQGSEEVEQHITGSRLASQDRDEPKAENP